MDFDDESEQEEWLSYNFNDEIADFLHLISNDLMPSDIFNRKIQLANLRERFDKPTTPNIALSVQLEFDLEPSPANEKKIDHQDAFLFDRFESFKNLLNLYKNIYKDGSPFDDYRNVTPNNSATKILVDSIRHGFVPPAEVIICIAYAFELYFEAAGSLTLEEVFFGKVKRGAGNYAKRLAKTEDRYSIFDYYVQRELHFFGTLEKLALHILKTDKSNDQMKTSILRGFTEENIDSFLKGYGRWKKSKR